MFTFVPTPAYYSPFHHGRQHSLQYEYLKAINEAQAARENYLQFLAAEEELRRQRQLRASYEHRSRREAELLSELALVRSGFSLEPDYPPYYRFGHGNGRNHRMNHQFVRDQGEELLADLFVLNHQPRVGFRPLGHVRHWAQTQTEPRTWARPSDIGNLPLKDWVEQPRKEPEVTGPKRTPHYYARCGPCHTKPLVPRCQEPPIAQPSCRGSLDRGDYAELPSRCQFACPRGDIPNATSTDQAKDIAPAGSSEVAASSIESIKEELERRLYSNPDIEIQDTARALLASLADIASPSESKADQPKSSSSQGVGAKGKAKEVSPSPPAGASTPVSVAASLNTLRDVESAFRALESNFVFPAHLDFDTTPPSPALSVHSNSSTPSSVLTYTSTNAPVRYYEHALSSLLTQLDAIESFGNEEIRARRKEIIARVESVLEEVEREVQGRLDAQKRREASSKKEREIGAEQVSSKPYLPGESAESAAPQLDATPDEEAIASTAESQSAPFAEKPLSTPQTPLPPAPGSPPPNRKRTLIGTLTDQTSTNSISTEGYSVEDETESLADSSLTVRAPSQGSDADLVPEPVDTFLLPASSNVEVLAPKSKDTISDDEAVLIDTSSDGGWSEVASDA